MLIEDSNKDNCKPTYKLLMYTYIIHKCTFKCTKCTYKWT